MNSLERFHATLDHKEVDRPAAWLVNGRQDGVFTIKRTSPRGFTLDIEAAGADRMMDEPFMVDTSVNPGWFYLGGQIISAETGDDTGAAKAENSSKGPDKVRLSGGQVIDNLADIVAKNGNMMLNVGLRPDGSLPETFRRELLDVGEWLEMNGKAKTVFMSRFPRRLRASSPMC